MKTVESSAVVAFRALVMLACLIFVPLAAIFGSVCPEIVRSTLIEPLLGPKTQPGGSRPGAPAEGLAGLAKLFGQSGQEQAGQDTVRPQANAGVAPAWQGPAGPAEPGSLAESRPGSDPAPAVNVAIPANYAAPAENTVNPNRPHAPQDALSANGPSGTGAAPAVIARAGHSEQAASGPDRFSVLEKRLREYGAIYYLLETWGNEGELYRFHCKMAIGNNPNYTRHFEATHRDALQAMNQVLEQIEQWRAGRAQ